MRPLSLCLITSLRSLRFGLRNLRHDDQKSDSDGKYEGGLNLTEVEVELIANVLITVAANIISPIDRVSISLDLIVHGSVM